MTGPRSAEILARRRPQQARSLDVVAAITEAAALVLAKVGARRFTTARVAERAGVSVGSVYQYFPNKAAILFRLQSDEWGETIRTMQAILGNEEEAPLDRLRSLVRVFVRSECEEAQMRSALNSEAPIYREAPEALETSDAGTRTIQAFMLKVLPDAPDEVRMTAGSLIKATLTEVGKDFSETPRSSAEIDAFADAMADMFCAYVERLQAPPI